MSTTAPDNVSPSGPSAGYTEEDIEKFRKIFRTVPSYEESISSKDVIPFLQSINYIKPLETYQKYIEYADKILGGRFEIGQLMKYVRVQHDPRLLMNEYLANFDRNNDGYVSKEEFEYGMETLRVHEPRIGNVSYKDFVKEADVNGDGKISVAECKDWLDKNISF